MFAISVHEMLICYSLDSATQLVRPCDVSKASYIYPLLIIKLSSQDGLAPLPNLRHKSAALTLRNLVHMKFLILNSFFLATVATIPIGDIRTLEKEMAVCDPKNIKPGSVDID